MKILKLQINPHSFQGAATQTLRAFLVFRKYRKRQGKRKANAHKLTEPSQNLIDLSQEKMEYKYENMKNTKTLIINLNVGVLRIVVY